MAGRQNSILRTPKLSAFQLLLRLYPSEFRDEYGREMTLVFSDRYRDSAGLWGRALAWAEAISGVVFDAPRVHCHMILQDLRYAGRLLRKSPGFTLTAVLSLAIGIGATGAIFSLLNALLLEDLPVSSPSDLVLITEHFGARESFSFSSPQFRDLKENSSLSGLAAFRPWRFRTDNHGESLLLNGQLVSGNYFSLLGLRAHLGRTLAEQDDQAPGASPYAVLAYRCWQREFDADPDVIGRKIMLQGYPFTIVGVTPPDFFGLEPGKEVDVTVPLAMQSVAMPGTPLLNSITARWLRLIGRRRPGVSAAQAQANLTVRWTQMLAAAPRRRGPPESKLKLLSGSQGLYDLRREFSLPLRILMSAVVLVLLVACANLAGLLIARSTARQQEIAIRLSLGASCARLVRQLLTESTLLSVIGGIGGLGLAYCGAHLLVDVISQGRTPIILDLAIHTRLLLFVTSISLATGLLLGIAPAFSTSSGVAGQGVRTVGGKPTRWAAALIVMQISLCVVVLAGAGLMWSSLRNLRRIDPGFREDHVLLMSIRPELSGYKGGRATLLYAELRSRFSSLPGVKSVTLSMDTPLGGISYTSAASRLGSPGQVSDALQVNVNSVGPAFFETMGVPLLSGRDLNLRDDDRGPLVAVITESVALGLFRGLNPLGQHIRIGESSMEIVGVAKDSRYQSLREPAQPMVYRPYLQMPGTAEELFFGIRTRTDPERLAALVRRELHATAPTVPVFSLTTLEGQVEAGLIRERMVSTLSAWFGGFVLLLAAIGLYGRLAYSVAERTREIAIRLALGARRVTVMWIVLREVLQLVLCGVVVGVPFAIASARTVRSLLYGLSPFDLPTLGVIVLTIIGVAGLAGYLPARRASQLDPIVALRYE